MRGTWRVSVMLLLTAVLAGCATSRTVLLEGTTVTNRDIMVTTGDIDRPYESLGIIQVTCSGTYLFGFIELVSANIEDAVKDVLADEAGYHGADAVINLNFYELQYPLLLKLASVFAIISPQYAVVTGELVQFTD